MSALIYSGLFSKTTYLVRSYESSLLYDIKPAIISTGSLSPSQGTALIALGSMIYLVIRQLISLLLIFVVIQSLIRHLRDYWIWKKLTRKRISKRTFWLMASSTIFLGLYTYSMIVLFFFAINRVILALIVLLLLWFVYEGTLLFIQSVFLSKKNIWKLLGLSYLKSTISLLVLILIIIIYFAIIYFLLASLPWLAFLFMLGGLIYLIGLRQVYLYVGVDK